jgi:Uma2 family endonuclease
MTVDEFFAWADGRTGRYELYRGEVYAMSPETAGHAETKAAVYMALRAAIDTCRLPYHVFPDGMTVRIDESTAFEPDAVVYSGEKIPRSAIEVPNPVIVVEVLSPSTRQFDASVRLASYFRLQSILHYLIVDPTEPMIVHHCRGAGDNIITRVVTEGVIALDPPGLELALGDIYTD